jgi:hypothetical protein
MGIGLVIARISGVSTEEEKKRNVTCPRLAAEKQDQLPFASLSGIVPHDMTIEQAWIGEDFPDTAGQQKRRTVGLVPIRFKQRHSASMA